jgi:hypothetical protein
MADRENKIRKVKQELEDISLYSAGKYSTQYLMELGHLVGLLYRWKQWTMLIDFGMQYLYIRKSTPYLEMRSKTCSVFYYVMEACCLTKQ